MFCALRFAKSNPLTSSVVWDELDTAGFEGATNDIPPRPNGAESYLNLKLMLNVALWPCRQALDLILSIFFLSAACWVRGSPRKCGLDFRIRLFFAAVAAIEPKTT
jgi:hypothetical protein